MKAWNSRKRWTRQLLAGGLLGLAAGTLAEDIDLFLGPPTAATGAPNVLFVLDNSTNWESIFEDWKGALQVVFEALPDKGINIGIMMFTPSTGGAANSGGYVRAGIREMTDDSGSDAGTKTLFSNMIGDFEAGGSTSDGESSGKISNTMAEAYAYFSKSAPRSGAGRDKTDYDNNTYSQSGCCASAREIWALPNSLDTSPIGMNALTGKNASPYQNILDEDSCAGNSIIVISNGPTQDATPINNSSANYLATVSGETPSVIDLTDYVEGTSESENPAKAAENWADEWARFMKKESDLAITTYTIDINVNPENGQGPNMTMLLKSMADQGEGEYYDLRGQEAFDPNDLVGALDDILSRILARNSVFASVALPASAGTSSTFLNQVFVGLFRPDPNQRPQWPGNLKQYKLGFDEDDGLLKVQDADGDAIATTDTSSQNIIIPCARSIWTPEISGRQPYWAFLNESGGCTESGESADYDTPDGPIVEKGGHAYVLRSSDPDNRVVYTCSATLDDCKDDADQLTDFDDSGSTPSAADLGVDAADLSEYVDWTIGYDLDDANKNTLYDDMRPYVHGDVVHSRPVALDYNLDPNDPDVVVFYGANDGMLRAINGNPDGSGAGSEYWSFLPPEFYPNVKLRRDNTSVIRFPSSGVYAGSGIAKPYAMDGPLATYAKDSDDDGDYDDVYLYAGMHRGGRVVYALEVSDIDAKPDLKWKIGCLNDPNDPDDCTTGTNEIGQTWSPFAIISAAGYDSGDTPLVIMGGGYDNCEDNDAGTGGANHDCDFDGVGGDDNTGNRIYILNALTGAILKTFETDRPVPGAVTVVPYVEGSDSYANLIKYAYAADTGGNIYRISADGDAGSDVVPRDIRDAAPADWIITKIAALGCDQAEAYGSDCTDGNPSNRKFIYGPDVVEIPETEYLAILVGSGDREKPLTDYESAYNVQNYFFSIVDRPLTANWLDDSGIDSGLCDQVDGADVLCMDSLTELGLEGIAGLAEGETLSQWGWKFPLDDHEQVVSGSLTISNDVYFSTHIPAVYEAGECEGNLGDAFTYQLDYLSADGKSTEIIGGGLVPTPVAGKVIIDGYDNPVPFCIGCGGENSPIGGTEVTGTISWDQPKNRVYWNIKQ